MTRPDGAYVCIVLRTGRRLIHWHWPKAGIVQCSAAAEIDQD